MKKRRNSEKYIYKYKEQLSSVKFLSKIETHYRYNADIITEELQMMPIADLLDRIGTDLNRIQKHFDGKENLYNLTANNILIRLGVIWLK